VAEEASASRLAYGEANKIKTETGCWESGKLFLLSSAEENFGALPLRPSAVRQCEECDMGR